uniref:Serine and arginine rich splicing factor 6b n=1 Tax=Xiphophorus maculatus TaxID=8083 RepID=A0A3B5R4M6_XIPMA
MPRVYIGRLSYHVREKDIQRFFSGYGKLMEIDLKNGYGFVEFEDNRDADDAVYELNGKDLCGERVIVEHARGPRRDRDSYGGGYWGGGSSSRSRSGRDKYGPPVRTEYRLIVENLSSRCSWQDLKDFMRQAGEVTYADAHKERTNEGVIEFRTHSDMKRAMDKLDGTDINGRKIRLVEDRPRKRRSYSGSRSRKSRSKSGERKSRSRTNRSRSGSHKSKSRSRSQKSRSRSADRKSKSRSKSRSKVKSEQDSRSRSKEMDVGAGEDNSKKSRSRSASPVENGKEERTAKSASRSPSPQEDERRSKSREKRSASRSVSRSRSRSRSRSASQD